MSEPRKKLIGAKAILRYLMTQHDIDITRSTLHRLRTAPEREFSCSDIAAGATRFPARTALAGLTHTLIAEPDEVDAWVARHRSPREPV